MDVTLRAIGGGDPARFASWVKRMQPSACKEVFEHLQEGGKVTPQALDAFLKSLNLKRRDSAPLQPMDSQEFMQFIMPAVRAFH